MQDTPYNIPQVNAYLITQMKFEMIHDQGHATYKVFVDV
jgi:hypothetical protein